MQAATPRHAAESLSVTGAASSAASGRPVDKTLSLPRILCLHGGGTNARIFHAQCRTLRAHLASSFRLVFADAPFLSPPGPDVETVYGDWGPFRSWLQGFTKLDADSIDASIATAVNADDAAGATGQWVGLLGFSQGAKLAASLLLRQQRQNQSQKDKGQRRPDYRFAVLIAGRAPLLAMDAGSDRVPIEAELLQLPTIHVHGLRDPGISMHRDLLHGCCQDASTRLVEWDGDHRVPVTTKDVAPVVAEIKDIAIDCGLLV